MEKRKTIPVLITKSTEVEDVWLAHDLLNDLVTQGTVGCGPRSALDHLRSHLDLVLSTSTYPLSAYGLAPKEDWDRFFSNREGDLRALLAIEGDRVVVMNDVLLRQAEVEADPARVILDSFPVSQDPLTQWQVAGVLALREFSKAAEVEAPQLPGDGEEHVDFADEDDSLEYHSDHL